MWPRQNARRGDLLIVVQMRRKRHVYDECGAVSGYKGILTYARDPSAGISNFRDLIEIAESQILASSRACRVPLPTVPLSSQ